MLNSILLNKEFVCNRALYQPNIEFHFYFFYKFLDFSKHTELYSVCQGQRIFINKEIQYLVTIIFPIQWKELEVLCHEFCIIVCFIEKLWKKSIITNLCSCMPDNFTFPYN